MRTRGYDLFKDCAEKTAVPARWLCRSIRGGAKARPVRGISVEWKIWDAIRCKTLPTRRTTGCQGQREQGCEQGFLRVSPRMTRNILFESTVKKRKSLRVPFNQDHGRFAVYMGSVYGRFRLQQSFVPGVRAGDTQFRSQAKDIRQYYCVRTPA